MNYDANYTLKRVLFLVLLCFWLPSCQDQIPEPTFTYNKSNRKKLGDGIAEAIRSNSDKFPLLDSSIPNNRALLNYLNDLYTLAYYHIRHDGLSSQSDRWNNEIDWVCNVLISDEKMAFCIPGGDFYVTTALLENLVREDFHLLYFMAFEVELMNKGYLYNNLQGFPLNDDELGEIVANGISSDGVTGLDLAEKITKSFTYDEDQVKEIDILSINNICRTIFSNQGIVQMNPSDGGIWFTSRPPYEERNRVLTSGDYIMEGLNCGSKRCSNFSCPIRNLIDNMVY